MRRRGEKFLLLPWNVRLKKRSADLPGVGPEQVGDPLELLRLYGPVPVQVKHLEGNPEMPASKYVSKYNKQKYFATTAPRCLTYLILEESIGLVSLQIFEENKPYS